MEMIANRLSLALLRSKGAPESSQITLIREAANKMAKIISRCTEPEAKQGWNKHINGLRFVEAFLAQNCTPIEPDKAYRSFAGEYTPATVPETLPKKIDPTGNLLIALKLMFEVDPEFAGFALSLFPSDTSIKVLPFRPAKKNTPSPGISYPREEKIAVAHWEKASRGRKKKRVMISPQEMCWVVAHELEHLLFDRFFSNFFIYPIYTEACFAFCIDIAKNMQDIDEARGVLKQMRVRSRAVRPKRKKGFEVEPLNFFSELRANLRTADMAAKISFYYHNLVSEGGWEILPNYMNPFGWEDILSNGKFHLRIAEEMLSLSHRFELTSLGRKYVAAESSFKREVKSALNKGNSKFQTATESLPESFWQKSSS